MILPIIAGIGLAIALIYWILTIVRRPRERPLKSVAVAHLASRPDYSAAFGAPPPAPAPAAPPPSAWADMTSPAPAPAQEAAPPDIPAPPDEPPDLPEPGDY
ncbi:MAG TPA: hypothetical protein VIJ91_01815 [Candidatus Dormibacteraeota bacterium]